MSHHLLGKNNLANYLQRRGDATITKCVGGRMEGREGWRPTQEGEAKRVGTYGKERRPRELGVEEVGGRPIQLRIMGKGGPSQLGAE